MPGGASVCVTVTGCVVRCAMRTEQRDPRWTSHVLGKRGVRRKCECEAQQHTHTPPKKQNKNKKQWGDTHWRCHDRPGLHGAIAVPFSRGKEGGWGVVVLCCVGGDMSACSAWRSHLLEVLEENPEHVRVLTTRPPAEVMVPDLAGLAHPGEDRLRLRPRVGA